MSALNDLLTLMKTNLLNYNKPLVLMSGKPPLYRYSLAINGEVVSETTSIAALAASARLLEIQLPEMDGQVDDE